MIEKGTSKVTGVPRDKLSLPLLSATLGILTLWGMMLILLPSSQILNWIFCSISAVLGTSAVIYRMRYERKLHSFLERSK